MTSFSKEIIGQTHASNNMKHRNSGGGTVDGGKALGLGCRQTSPKNKTPKP
jgi:hypothetical protein